MKFEIKLDEQTNKGITQIMAGGDSTSMLKTTLLKEMENIIEDLLKLWKQSSLAYYARLRQNKGNRYPPPGRTHDHMTTDVVSSVMDVSAIAMRVSGFIWVPEHEVPWWRFVNYGRTTWQTGVWWEGYHYMEHGMEKIEKTGNNFIQNRLGDFIYTFRDIITQAILKQTKSR